MKSKSLTITKNDFYSIEADINNFNSKEIVSNRINTKDLMSSIILSQSNSLIISALLKVTGQIHYGSTDEKKTSFIQLSHDNLYLENVRQWKLIKDIDLLIINNKLNEFFTMKYLNKSQVDSRLFEISQKISLNSKKIEHIMIQSNFKFLNALWNTNTAYIKFADDIYWLEHHNWQTTSCDEEIWTSHIKFIIPFKKYNLKSNDINITFGINLSQENNDCPEIIKNYDLRKIIMFEDLQISVK